MVSSTQEIIMSRARTVVTPAAIHAAAERAQPWRVRRGGVANSEPSRIYELEAGDAALMTKPVELNHLLLDDA
ncbi:hypothetical protein [Streptomyces flaveolus]|uniref:hypothetical protein n=1 Tax=Streptomyces flaveolus TaxID=67297 RepID=UPI0036FF4007